ncbi:mitochondrial import inner membrane translocase subunit Tim21 isoform 2-T2 [Megaptera novaeangliae]
MGAARAEENGATWVYFGSHPENHLDAKREPAESEGGRQQTSVCAQKSERGNRHLNVTESERSWKRFYLFNSGAYWNHHYRLKNTASGLFYTIFRELFSSSSPNKIYGKALEKCRLHPEVLSVFGEPIKGYGEMTRRGRRQHVSFIEYVKDGLKHMRVKFYIQGSEPGKQGTVHLEVKENPESGEYEFQYIFVELEPHSRRTIVIEDNRS